MDKENALARRLASYSAAAGVALACAPEANAQIVYHDLRPDAVVHTPVDQADTINLDFDDDGVDDLQLIGCGESGPGCGVGRYYTYNVALRTDAGMNTMNGVLGYEAPRFPDPIVGGASRLSSGAVVGPSGTGQGFYRRAIAASALGSGYNPPHYPFTGAEGYAGFRFIAGDGQLHYGWLRLAATDNADTGTVYEYAYEAAPDTPIAAGARSAALLSGDVNRRHFPASGGTLRYTFTAENTTTDPLPLDLWIDVERPAGVARETVLLGSGTLGPGEAVTRTVRLRVPAEAPMGRYRLKAKLGEFVTRRFLTFQAAWITKEGPAGSGRDSGSFVTAAVAGDLFAGAEASDAIPGTHALSAPAPNPTTGRAEVSLTVAEAQAVTVAVYDALGRRVALLHEGPMAAGTAHRLAFDGSGLPAGVYVVRAVGEAFSDSRVLTLTR